MRTEHVASSSEPHGPTADPDGTGVEPPVPEWVDVSQTLERWFAFVDVCGFTTFTERNGTPAALEVLTRFRSAVRAVTGRRGVRVLKWLGDGAMLVGVAPGPVIAAVCELRLRFDEDAFDIHAGIAGGNVLLFEGDDYIGPAANHASRLCEAAAPGEVLARRRRGPPARLGAGGRAASPCTRHGIGDLHGCREARRRRVAVRPPRPATERRLGVSARVGRQVLERRGGVDAGVLGEPEARVRRRCCA